MPVNKSALIRYQALDRCFSDPHRRYYFYDLIEACQNALSKLYDKKETVSRRSLFYDMAFMASEHGYNAPIEHLKDGTKKYYRYRDPSFTINRQPLNDLETSQLKEALGLLSRLSGRHEFTLVNDLIPKIEKFLHLESSPPIISYEENKDLWESAAVKNNLNKFGDKKFNIIISCGDEDFFIDINRELHEKMLEAGIKHTYIERPGRHDWDYWREEIKFQLLFFSNYLK